MKQELVFEAPRRALPPRHLADLDEAGRVEAVAALDLPRFRAKQLAHQYYGRLIADPQHPYTRALLTAIPRLTPGHRTEAPALLGDPPSPIRLPAGCRFNPRCSLATELCSETEPGLIYGNGSEADHAAACHYAWSDAPVATSISEPPSHQ